MHYLYRITNIANGKVYIGQTNNLSVRKSAHKSNAYNEDSKSHGSHLSNSIRKYTWVSFRFEHIATCKTREDADQLECALIQQYDSLNPQRGYNEKPGGNTAGHSEATRAKLSAQKTEFYQKRLEETGSKTTVDERKKLSDSHIGIPNMNRILSDEQENAVCKDYVSGMTGDDLAEKYRINRTSIYKCFKKHNILMRPNPPPIHYKKP